MYHTGTPTQNETGHWLVPLARDADGVIVAYGTSADQDEAMRRAWQIGNGLEAMGSDAVPVYRTNTPK